MRSFRWTKLGLLALALVGCLIAFQYRRRIGERIGLVTTQGDSQVPTTPQGTPGEQVRLTPQARRNLKLTSKPVVPQVFWRTIEVPGVVVDRPGISDRGVTSPVTGVVTKAHSFPGDTVQPGDVLFTLRLVSESLHTSQMELFKATREIEITKEQRQRLANLGSEGAVPQMRIIELDNQLRRLEVVVQAYRQELQVRGIATSQIDDVTQGTFVAEVEVKAPPQRPPSATLTANEKRILEADEPDLPFRYEVQELKVELGQQVQAGQTLCLLSDHSVLLIEGRCFHKELGLVQQAAKDGTPLEVEFLEESAAMWKSLSQTFRIQHVANTVDSASRTLPFYVPLANQRQDFERDGKRLLLWRYRPGQRVRFTIPVEKFDDVFIVPADAVVREGPEVYVFRQNGDFFDRKPVHLLFEDRSHAVLANDGSVPRGIFVVQGSALQLNRVLKSQGGEGTKGVHVHADGSVHANH